MRQKVEDDRGLVKKIEMAIPGFRGYRKREDLRIADRLLREQLADMLGSSVKKLESARGKLADAKDLKNMDRMRKLVNSAATAENRVRHAEQGYTGVSPDYRIEEDELNRLYEWDLGLLREIERVTASASDLDAAAGSESPEDVAGNMKQAAKSLDTFIEIFDKRREAIAGLLVER